MKIEETLKAYDIRGTIDIIDQNYTKNLALNLLEVLNFNSVTISYDTRGKSKEMAEVLMSIFINKDKKVYNLEICSTPMSYFLTKKLETDIGIIVTASHNPDNYLGFKFYDKNLIPYSPKEIFKDFKQFKDLDKLDFTNEYLFSNKYEKIDFKSYVNNYYIHNYKYENLKKKKFVIDFSNGSAISYEHDFLTNNFPNSILINTTQGKFKHSLNPLDPEAIVDAQKTINEFNLDFGIVYDTDADRTVLLDERKQPVSGDDLLLLLIYIQNKIMKKKIKILYDVRSTREIKKYAKKNKIESFESIVGHYYIKKLMNKNDIDIGGEKSSHIYFKESSYTENSLILLYYLDEFFSEDLKLSKTIEKLHSSISTEELNYKFKKDKEEIINDISDLFSEYKQYTKDGISIESNDFWFNIRFSNTENLLRLNLEAKNKEILMKLKSIIEKYLKKSNI